MTPTRHRRSGRSRCSDQCGDGPLPMHVTGASCWVVRARPERVRLLSFALGRVALNRILFRVTARENTPPRFEYAALGVLSKVAAERGWRMGRPFEIADTQALLRHLEATLPSAIKRRAERDVAGTAKVLSGTSPERQYRIQPARDRSRKFAARHTKDCRSRCAAPCTRI